VEPLRVGSLTVQPFQDGVAVLEPSMFTVGEAAADWSAHAELLDTDGLLRVPVGAFVVRAGDVTVLLDAGVGPTSDPMFSGHELIANMAAGGVAPADIDVVFVSHCHNDHCGWLEQDGTPTFPNATIRIGAGDWTHFVDGAGGGRKRAARLRAVESRVELIDRDGEVIAPGITTRATPGHTPGHTSAVLSSDGARMIMMGDAMHCPAQLTESEWQFLYDVDRDLASRTRADLLREAEAPNTALLPAHFPGMRATRLLPAQAGPRVWSLG
jgi:glyoxylase-like metal-dependent hydrolase (beta-lactamase superfamily II)